MPDVLKWPIMPRRTRAGGTMKYCKWCDYNDPNDPANGVCYDYVDCPIHEKFWDWKDAAEFEARVALKLAHCIDGLQNLFPPEEFPKLPYQQILKIARLTVEEQMEP